MTDSVADAQVTIVEWKILNELTQFIADGGHDELSHDLSPEVVSFEPEFLAKATLIAAEAWDRCAAWLEGVSPTERKLIREQDERMLRRRRWLDDYLRILCLAFGSGRRSRYHGSRRYPGDSCLGQLHGFRPRWEDNA
jgi:hypothetical protein